jgi:hypothetical protein
VTGGAAAKISVKCRYSLPEIPTHHGNRWHLGVYFGFGLRNFREVSVFFRVNTDTSRKFGGFLQKNTDTSRKEYRHITEGFFKEYRHITEEIPTHHGNRFSLNSLKI